MPRSRASCSFRSSIRWWWCRVCVLYRAARLCMACASVPLWRMEYAEWWASIRRRTRSEPARRYRWCRSGSNRVCWTRFPDTRGPARWGRSSVSSIPAATPWVVRGFRWCSSTFSLVGPPCMIVVRGLTAEGHVLTPEDWMFPRDSRPWCVIYLIRCSPQWAFCVCKVNKKCNKTKLLPPKKWQITTLAGSCYSPLFHLSQSIAVKRLAILLRSCGISLVAVLYSSAVSIVE